MQSQLMEYQAEADAAMGTHAPSEAYKAFCGQLFQRKPDLKGPMKRFLQANGIGQGLVPTRKRFDFKYSRVGIGFDSSGDLQKTDPTSLFTIQIGGTDPVLGALTETDTNVINAGKQDSSEAFKAYAVGFTLQLVDQNVADLDDLVALYRALLENTSAILTLGTQNRQRFPTLQSLPGIGVGFQTSGGATLGVPTVATATATQGAQSLIRFTTPVWLGASDSYAVELKIKRSLTGAAQTVDLIPNGAQYADLILAIQCIMYGISYTGIPG